jgi:hypothetical protein
VSAAAVIAVAGAGTAVSHAEGAPAGALAADAAASVRADFDGDGYTDVAIAAPGGPLTAADLDGDGFSDLVVGAPGEDIGSARDVGLQTVVWGGAGGLATVTTVGQGRAETRAGHFDGDGHLDLATAYQMRYGPFTRSGAAARTGPLVDLDVRVYAMEAGDVDGDGTTDLVVSSGPWDSDDGGTIPPPRLRLLKGTGNGLVAGPFIAYPDTVSADSTPSVTSTPTVGRTSSSAAARRQGAVSRAWCAARRTGSRREPR